MWVLVWLLEFENLKNVKRLALDCIISDRGWCCVVKHVTNESINEVNPRVVNGDVHLHILCTWFYPFEVVWSVAKTATERILSFPISRLGFTLHGFNVGCFLKHANTIFNK